MPETATTSDDAIHLAVSIVEALACSGVVRSSVPWEDVCELIEPAILAHLTPEQDDGRTGEHQLSWKPATPKPGDGDSFATARMSALWPGRYEGRCRHCRAFFVADKRAPRCDPCELARRAAASSRPAAECHT